MSLIWLRLFAVPVANNTLKMKDTAKKLKLFGAKGEPTISDIGQG
jgi:hypothetical protein